MNETVRPKPRGAALAAVAMERLFEPRVGSRRPRPRFLAYVLLGLLLHLTLLGFLLWQDQRSAPPPVEEEIPIEVITEPPPPPEEKKEEPPPPEPPPPEKQEQKKPPPPPPPPPEEEKPAYDAPKAESKVKSDVDAPEEAKEAKTKLKEPEKVAPKDDKPQGLKEGAEEDAESDKKPEPAPQKLEEDKPDAEIIERAEKAPTPVDKPEAKDSKPAKKGDSMTIADMVAAMAPLPDYKLAAPPKTSPVGGGQARTTYLSILYGLIMPHMRIPPRVREAQTPSRGVVAFYIDEMGNLTHQAIYKTSGFPDLDAAALAAVRAAAPYPAPPRGLPHAMLFSYATK